MDHERMQRCLIRLSRFLEAEMKKGYSAQVKWRTLIVSVALILALPFIFSFVCEVYFWIGTAIPGASAFHTYFDSAHGMSVTSGTFDLGGGKSVSVSCWSPREIKRTKFFEIFLQYPGYPGMHKPGDSVIQSVAVKAGDYSFNLDAFMDANRIWVDGVRREQLRRIANAREVILDLGNGQTFYLKEEQLTQLRNLISYTDTLPLYNFPPEDEEESSKDKN